MLRSKTLLLGSCSFEPSALMLRDAAGNALALRSQSLRVLAELSRTPGALVTREALIDAVWGRVAVTDDSVTQCIRDIRAALSDRDRSILKTVVGRGYILNARDALDTVGGLPVVRLERFRATDGIAEEIGETLFEELLVRLTPRRGIRVTADHDLTPTMNSYVVSGRVSVRPDNARVFYRIERHGAAGTLHAATEDAEGDAIWDLPRQVADIIAAQLRTQVLVSAGSDLADADDSGLTAQQLLTKAGWHMTRLQRDSWLSARRSLQRAVLLSPKNPTALSMLAAMETLMIPLIPFDEVAPNVERAMELCDLAVELDPSNDWVLRTRGNARMWLLHDHEGARLDCEKALTINPAYDLAHLTIATSEILTGALDAGQRRLEEMLRRTPFDVQGFLHYSLMALARLLSGDRDTAMALAREGHERNPLGAWNALVYATTAADDRDVLETAHFQRMLQRIDLPPSHFTCFPFSDPDVAIFLSARARAAGVREPNST